MHLEYFQCDDDGSDFMINVLLERYSIKSKYEIFNIAEEVFDENLRI